MFGVVVSVGTAPLALLELFVGGTLSFPTGSALVALGLVGHAWHLRRGGAKREDLPVLACLAAMLWGMLVLLRTTYSWTMVYALAPVVALILSEGYLASTSPPALPRPAASPAAAPPVPVRPPPEPSKMECPYCGAGFPPEQPFVRCRRCDTPHHKDCWSELRRCTTYGCTSRDASPATWSDA